jgi:hypothetical protein
MKFSLGKWISVSIILLACLALNSAAAQGKNTEHTFKLDDKESRPEATLADVAWLAGAWSGEAFGDRFEEVWNPPSAGSMLGFFKLLKGDQVAIYELLLLVEEEGSLNLKVKHFNPDFSAWEDKEDYLNFRLVKVEEEAIHFSGISFYRTGPDSMKAYLVMNNEEKIWEEELIYQRSE